MATSSGGGGLTGNIYSFLAADDYSSYQYCPVKLTSTADTIGTCSAVTDEEIGILQNDPESGKIADVAIGCFISKAVTSGTCSIGDRLIVGTDSKLRATLSADDANARQNYIALETASTTAASGGGDIISVIRQPSIGTTA